MSPIVNVLWGVLAVFAYAGVWGLTTWALRPKIDWHPYPDWFWGPDTVLGDTYQGWQQVKPEQSDRPASEPESEAG